MKNSKTSARVTGVLFILGTATGVAAAALNASVLSAQDYLGRLAHRLRLELGCEGRYSDRGEDRMMSSHKENSRLLGVAFLVQFVTSFGSGLFLTAAWKVHGNIVETMTRMSANPMLVRVTIVADLATALGVIFLGAILYLTLRNRNEKAAIVGMLFYVLEGILLAFCLGAIPLYYLLYTSRAVPRLLALWGLVTVFPCLLGTMSALLFDRSIPFAFYLPYVPFELVIAIWILVKGVPEIMPRERE